MRESPFPPLATLARHAALAVVYGLGALGVWMVSHGFWFLPAGWRLGWFWLAPFRLWPWLFCAEAAVWLLAPRGSSRPSLDVLLAPAIYLAVIAAVRVVRRRHSESSVVPWLIGAGLTAAGINSLLIAVTQGHASDLVAALWKAPLYWLGDAVGCLALASSIVALFGHKAAHEWRLHGARWLLLFVPVALYWAALRLAEPDSSAAAPVLAGAALVALALQGGWRATALAILPLSASMRVASMQGFTSMAGFELQLIALLTALAGLLLGDAADRLHLRMVALRDAHEALNRNRNDLLQATTRLVGSQEEERNRIGRELHDGLGQTLSAVRMRLHMVRRQSEDVGTAMQVSELDSLISTSQDELYVAIEALQPVDITRRGLEAALHTGPIANLLADSGIAFDLDFALDAALPEAVEATLYRICQEAANNATKGRRARCFSIALRSWREDENHHRIVELALGDDAGELPSSNPKGTSHHGHGLQNIRDRATALDAQYRFDSLNGEPRHWLQFQLE